MTQEQKAKAYDEVRKKIALRFGPNVVEEIFSEFEMSEDERMVKFIKEQLFKIRETIVYNSNLDRELANAIAWLEKQNEKKPADKVELDACIDWLKALKPQNTWKPSDEQMKALLHKMNLTEDISYAG